MALARLRIPALATTAKMVRKPMAKRLLAWDAAFYADIAHGGYDAVPRAGLRFFPLVPLLARAVAVVLRGVAAYSR